VSGSHSEDERLALGPDWWVLDNALRLHRELGEKKGREVLQLRDLQTWYPSFPEGPVFAWETPDFLVETRGGWSVGLELVEVHRGGTRRRGSRHREREEAEETVLRLAEEIYYADDPPGPVCAHLSWPADQEDARVGPLPRPTWELATQVARLVREGAPAWAGGGRLELGPEELRGTPLDGVLYGISARRTGFVDEDGRDSRWGRTLSYALATAGVADLAREIAKKDRVYAACKEAGCTEAWLVAVLAGGPSSFDDADDAVLHHPFRSDFDRVVVLCPSGRPDRCAFALLGTG
jgi:hypothetical protein